MIDYTNVTTFIKMTLNSRQTVNKENTVQKEQVENAGLDKPILN